MNETPNPLVTTPEPVTQPAVTSPQVPPIQAETPVAPPKPKRTKLLVLGALVILFVLAGAALLLFSRQSQPQPVPVLPTPTEFVTPTPPQPMSAIATTSAFKAFQGAVASFSATLNEFTFTDGTFTPPIFQTDLGLTQ